MRRGKSKLVLFRHDAAERRNSQAKHPGLVRVLDQGFKPTIPLVAEKVPRPLFFQVSLKSSRHEN